MMALTERTLDNRLAAAAAGGDEAVSLPKFAAESDFAENAQFLADELNALRREQAKLQQAIFEAAQVQRRLCAPRDLQWAEYQIAGEIFPVRYLSGDFFKVMELGRALGLAVGDIAGKGLTAGIWQAHLMGLLQRAARRHADPEVAVAEVNRELCDDGEPPLTAVFFARIHPQKNELRYCNAGLPAPLLLRSDQTLERLEKGGPMLGALKSAAFQAGTVVFNPGDMLVAYSDGVTECRNPADDEFEMQRLIAAAQAVLGMGASKALFSLLGTVLDFADTCSPGDDLTLLVVRRREAAKGVPPRSRNREISASRRRSSAVSRPRNAGRGGRSPE
jgi:sigma-B regulation protein RsbU (phosphoserine phosphatase)